MDRKKFEKCIACGVFTVVGAELLFCHECMEKIHESPHMNDIGVNFKQAGIPTYSESITASPSLAPEETDLY